jgi:histidine triad (HIT) family protein
MVEEILIWLIILLKNIQIKMEDCVFCKIAKGEISSQKILETDNFFAIKDLHPKTQGHSLVISKKHYNTILDMPSSLLGEFFETGKKLALKLLKEENAQGFNLVINNYEVAGQAIPHLHLHVLPRKKDDSFRMNV